MSIFDGYSDEDAEAMQDGILFELKLMRRKAEKEKAEKAKADRSQNDIPGPIGTAEHS